MRSAVEQAVNGGEKNERVSVKLAQDQSGKAVIVAKDRRLLRIDVGDGVIFIYHGDRAQLEKFFKGLAKNAIAIQITEIIFGNQHLRDLDAVGPESSRIRFHQFALTHSGAR